MTNREFYNAIVSSDLDSAIIEFAQNKLVQMDKANENRKSKPSKRSIENEPIKKVILENIGEGVTASDVAPKVEITVQKASALLRQLVAEGVLTVEDVKMPKKGVVKFYKVA